jgi:hypothetical protein
VSPQVDTSTWRSYTSTNWGYSFDYPTQWFELGTLGAPATEEYLSNEKVGSPISLSATGLFVAISIHNSSSADCAHHGVPAPVAIDRTEGVTVDGTQSTLYAIGGGEPYFQLNVMPSGTFQASATRMSNYCYMFSFVFKATSVRDTSEPTVRALIGTFRFGSPTAPAP